MYSKIFTSTSQLSRACLVAAFPAVVIFDPLTSFSSEAGSELIDLQSSAGQLIWLMTQST